MRARTTLGALLAVTSALVTSSSADAQTNAPAVSIDVVTQSMSVEIGAKATITVRVTGAPADVDIDLTSFTPVDEDGVRAAADGHLPDRRTGFLPRVPLASVLDANGTATITFAAVSSTPQLDEQIRIADPGVYPLRIRVLGRASNDALGQAITFIDRPSPGITLPVAIVLPLPGTPSLGIDGTVAVDRADSDRLTAVTQLLNDRPNAPLTLAPRPELLVGLTRTNPGILDRLATAAAAANRQVLAGSYVRLDIPAMLAANLGGEVANQFAIGERAVGDALPGVRTDRRIWMADSALDAASLAELVRLGTQSILIGADRLQPSGASPTNRPIELATSDPALRLQGLVVEPALRDRLQPSSDPVTAAYRLAFELVARARGDQPGRGVVLMPRETWKPDLTFLHTLIDALSATTTTQPVTLDGFLRSTSVSRDARREIVAGQPTDMTPYARGLFVTRVAIDHLRSVLPSDTHRFDGMSTLTTVAGSADLSAIDRQAYLDAINERLFPVRRALTAKARSQITLAGRSGTLPVTLDNSLDESVTVKLRVASTKLTVTDNDRSVTVPAKGSLTVQVSVEARTSAWRFPVDVQMLTPTGDDRLTEPVTFDLRVVGLSGLGIGASAAGVLVLATWWLTHTRGRRRSKTRKAHASAHASGPRVDPA